MLRGFKNAGQLFFQDRGAGAYPAKALTLWREKLDAMVVSLDNDDFPAG